MIPLVDRSGTDPDGWAIRSAHHGRATWAETTGAVLQLATAIKRSELGDERRAMVIAHNYPATLVAHAAIVLGEAASVPVNHRLTAAEIEYVADESGARLAFVDALTAQVTREAVRDLDVTVVELPDQGIIGPALGEFIGDTAAARCTADQRVIPSLLFTSGTTGRPKAVQLPPKTIGDSADLAGFVDHVMSHRLAQHDTHLVAGPLYHNGPLTSVRLLIAGVPIVVHDRFEPERALAAIDEFRVETSIMVPTHFVRLLALPAAVREKYDMSSLRAVAHTGGACPIDVKRAMIEWWGPVLSESYGGTESGTVCSINSMDWLEHPGSVGRAVPPFEAVVIGPDGNEAPPNTDGRLYFRDSTGRGIVYEGDPVKTAAAHIAPGVFTLGEIGHIDDDGYVFITDRFSDMVVSGGVNIYPAEVEHALVAHPDVVDATCIGVPDATMGERMVGLVELAPGVEPDPDALQSWCRRTLAGYKCPRELRFVDELPRNPMGKIDKQALRSTIA